MSCTRKGYVLRVFLLSLTLLYALTHCSSAGLPEEAKTALNKSITKLVGSELEYKIISAQKAPGSAEERQVEIQLPSDSGVSGCPPDYGDRETWCVVIDRGIAGVAGRTYSHFLLRRVGNSWYVEELTDAEARRFEYVGCSNWNAIR